MDKIRYYIFLFFTFVLPFGLIYYISGPIFYTSISITTGFACVLLIMSIFKNLHPYRDLLFIVISILSVGIAVGKVTNPFMCGGASGLFVALVYIYFMNKYVWTGPIKQTDQEDQKQN